MKTRRSPPARTPSSADSASRSLLLTGLADVWAALRRGDRDDPEPFGIVLMLLSALAFALMAALAKKLLPETPVQAVVLSRSILLSLVFLVGARVQRAPVLSRRPWTLLARGLFGYGALSCYLYSVQHLPLGDAVLLQYSHPVFVASIAPLFLGEPTARGHWPLVGLSLLGVALIVRPSGEIRAEALVGVTGAVLSSFAYLFVRRLSRDEHPTTIMLWFPLACVPFSLVATAWLGEAALPRDGREVAGHLLVAAAALVGQIFLTLGLTRAGAARATAATMAGPVFGLGLGFAFFGNVPAPASLAGTALVLSALLALGLRRRPVPTPVSSRPGARPG